MPTTFPNAVHACDDIHNQYLKNGLGALTSKYRQKVTQGEDVKISGSVYLDEAIGQSGEKCVDFAIGVQVMSKEDDRVIFLEIHPATDKEVIAIVGKFDFILKWLTQGGVSLGQLKRKHIWIASGSSHLSPASIRKLNALGVVFLGGHLAINKKLFS